MTKGHCRKDVHSLAVYIYIYMLTWLYHSDFRFFSNIIQLFFNLGHDFFSHSVGQFGTISVKMESKYDNLHSWKWICIVLCQFAPILSRYISRQLLARGRRGPPACMKTYAGKVRWYPRNQSLQRQTVQKASYTEMSRCLSTILHRTGQWYCRVLCKNRRIRSLRIKLWFIDNLLDSIFTRESDAWDILLRAPGS